MPEPLVVVDGVNKTFGTGEGAIAALKEVHLTAKPGELLMIVGPSGCGKTTLLSVIAGTLHFDSGEVTVLGSPLSKMSEEEVTAFRRVNIGFIFQQFHLIKALTASENISIPLLLNQVSYSNACKEANSLMEKMGMKDRAQAKPNQLSGGQQQRVAIARAIVHDPKVVICDEPTSSLDAETGHSIMELLSELSHVHERAVILVTHDNRIFKYADRIIKMDDGRIVNHDYV